MAYSQTGGGKRNKNKATGSFRTNAQKNASRKKR